MRVWIDHDLCTGDGLCTDHCPDMFTLLEDGISYVHHAGAPLHEGGLLGAIPVERRCESAVVAAALDCPGECIFIEPDDESEPQVDGVDDADIVDADVVGPPQAGGMMAPFESPPSLVVLHTVRINGRALTAWLPELTGLRIETIDDELSAAVGAGWLQHHDGIVPGWSLTPAGRQRHLEQLTDERATAGREAEILAAYDDLMTLNDSFKRLCTEWQLHDHPISCIERLATQHPRVDATTRRLADTLTRFRPYPTRLAGALHRLQEGDRDAFTTPLTDSYYDIWMQLHEDLLLTLGRERSSTDGS